jgi:hypothetical protein
MKLRKIFCILGLHSWKYKREKHRVTNHPEGREFVRVVVRECEVCGHREHHLLPKHAGFTRWTNFDHVAGDATIKYEEI